MIDEFRAFISIYQTGKELSDKNVWRNRARLANIFTILISAIFMGLFTSTTSPTIQFSLDCNV